MNWVWIAMLMEAIAKILEECPEPEKQPARLFSRARKPERLTGRKLLRAIRITPIGFDNEGDPIYPRGREAVRLFKETSLAIKEMSDDELKDNIAIVCEIYEENQNE